MIFLGVLWVFDLILHCKSKTESKPVIADSLALNGASFAAVLRIALLAFFYKKQTLCRVKTIVHMLVFFNVTITALRGSVNKKSSKAEE